MNKCKIRGEKGKSGVQPAAGEGAQGRAKERASPEGIRPASESLGGTVEGRTLGRLTVMASWTLVGLWAPSGVPLFVRHTGHGKPVWDIIGIHVSFVLLPGRVAQQQWCGKGDLQQVSGETSARKCSCSSATLRAYLGGGLGLERIVIQRPTISIVFSDITVGG